MTTADFVRHLDGVHKTARGWTARCPAHDDQTPSLTVTDRDEKTLVHCHAGCSAEAVTGALGLQLADLYARPAPSRRLEIEEEYTYHDENGGPLYQVLRLPKKGFLFRHRCPDRSGGWTWSAGGKPDKCSCPDLRRVPYHLPELIEAIALEKTVLVAEGEKDADRLRSAGFPATTNPGGAGKWPDEFREHFRDARVVIVPDQDPAGRDHARRVGEQLAQVVHSLRVLELPVPDGDDVSDWMDAGADREALEARVGHARPWQEWASSCSDSEAPETSEPHREAKGPSNFPAPMSISELQQVEPPEVLWLVEGLIPAGGNLLLGGYPKTSKTMLLLDLAVALVTGGEFLGFSVPNVRRRVGLVLMEDQMHHVCQRLERLCAGRAMELEDLHDRLFIWFRPPLKLVDSAAQPLARWAGMLDLDFLGVDSWSYVASGDSDSADQVMPQLQALSAAAEQRPGLTVALTHHARKDPGPGRGRSVTDRIRGSSAFGAWFDVAIVLSRQGEGPVTVHMESRDHPPPDPLKYDIQDEIPASANTGWKPSGWLRLERSQTATPHTSNCDKRAVIEGNVLAFVRENPGCGKRQIRAKVTGGNRRIDQALKDLEGKKVKVERNGTGRRNAYYPLELSK